MPNYRRLDIPGGTYFFTVTLFDRSSDLLTRRIDDLRDAYRMVQKELPFETIAICVLPDHLHCVWKLPENDHDFSTRWKKIKREFSVRVPKTEDVPGKRPVDERGIWQKRFWEHLIRDDEDLARHVDYVHFDPVKHQFVTAPNEWPYSTWSTLRGTFGQSTSIGGFHPPYDD